MLLSQIFWAALSEPYLFFCNGCIWPMLQWLVHITSPVITCSPQLPSTCAQQAAPYLPSLKVQDFLDSLSILGLWP